MFMIFALPPEGSVCLFIRFCWNHLLLLEEEKPPFPEGLQTRAAFSQCYLLLNNQPKLSWLETKVVIISRGSVGGVGLAGLFPRGDSCVVITWL